MRSQKLTGRFGTSMAIDSTDLEKEEILCYHHPSYTFNRDTYQMSPLLFESDTEDTSQSTEIKCYQEKTITPQSPTTTAPDNLQIFDVLTTLHDLRNEFEIASQLDTSSQHNQCCSETLLNSSNRKTATIVTKVNTNHDYVSPSPRVTRLKLLNSRILTRSAKRLHKISEFSEYSESPRNSRKGKTKKDLSSNGRRSSSTNAKDAKSMADDSETREQILIESIKKSKVRVVLERLKFPFFQNPHQIGRTFIQPNIVPNIEVDHPDIDLDFLNRRLSSEVQMFTERSAVISLSSESTIRNASTTPRGSPDLFENFESSSISYLCSQTSFDIPNGQILMPDAERRTSETATSTPNSQHDATLAPSIYDLFDCVTPDVNAGRQNLLADEDKKLLHQQTFEITVNEVFDNVIHVVDSDETITSQIGGNPAVACRTVTQNIEPQQVGTSDALHNFMDLTKCASSQEVTPKKRPEIHDLLNKSLGACPSNVSPTLLRSKWLSKPKSSNSDGDLSHRTTQRCRRLELWFHNETKPRMKGNADGKSKFTNLLLTSSEEEDS